MMIDSLPPLEDRQPCAAYRHLLDDLVAEEMDTAPLARVVAHVAHCTDCHFAVEQARTYRRTMQRVGAGLRAPASLRDRVVALLRESRGPHP